VITETVKAVKKLSAVVIKIKRNKQQLEQLVPRFITSFSLYSSNNSLTNLVFSVRTIKHVESVTYSIDQEDGKLRFIFLSRIVSIHAEWFQISDARQNQTESVLNHFSVLNPLIHKRKKKHFGNTENSFKL